MARRSPLEALLAPRLAALRDARAEALAGIPPAVHRARVSSRRLREVLPALREALPAGVADHARSEVRRLTRALGGVRELDVALALFAEMAVRHDVPPAAEAAVRRALAADRAGAVRRLRTTMTRSRLARLDTALERAAEAASATQVSGASAVAIAQARVARRAARVRRALDRAGALYLPERLHRVRIAVKQLRYAVEVLSEAQHRRATAPIAELRAIQDRLGHAHDLHVLAERVRDVQAAVVRRSRDTASALGRLADALDNTCRTEHAAFMSRRQDLLALCDTLERGGAAASRRSVA
jgi:CHAD domain-containing protein